MRKCKICNKECKVLPIEIEENQINDLQLCDLHYSNWLSIAPEWSRK
jgi:hypothetical protein